MKIEPMEGSSMSSTLLESDLDTHTITKAYARWAPVYDLVFGAVFERGRHAAIAAAERVGGRAHAPWNRGDYRTMNRLRLWRSVAGFVLAAGGMAQFVTRRPEIRATRLPKSTHR